MTVPITPLLSPPCQFDTLHITVSETKHLLGVGKLRFTALVVEVSMLVGEANQFPPFLNLIHIRLLIILEFQVREHSRSNHSSPDRRNLDRIDGGDTPSLLSPRYV